MTSATPTSLAAAGVDPFQAGADIAGRLFVEWQEILGAEVVAATDGAMHASATALLAWLGVDATLQCIDRLRRAVLLTDAQMQALASGFAPSKAASGSVAELDHLIQTLALARSIKTSHRETAEELERLARIVSEIATEERQASVRQ